MLLLTFRTGKSLYAIEARRVAEVVPRVDLRPIPLAPAYLAGLLNYRGGVVPVIDFGLLTGSRAGRDALSTRLILTSLTSHDSQVRLIGIVAEEVSQVVQVEEGQFVSASMSLDEAPFLGAMVRLDGGLAQLVDADKLLLGRMREALYGEAVWTA